MDALLHKRSKEAVNNVRRLTKSFDLILGGSCCAFAAIAVLRWHHGQVSTYGINLLLLYIAFNMIVSQFMMRVQNVLALEFFRHAVSAILCPLVMWNIPGILGVLTGYMVTYVGGLTWFGLLYGERRYNRLFMFCWIANFTIATAVMQAPNWEQYGCLAILFLFTGLSINEMTKLLQRSFEKEFEWFKEREDAHAQLVRSSKFAALGEMAGGIAHEINNPLTIVIGRARQIERVVKQAPTNAVLDNDYVMKIIEYAQMISETSQRIASIVSGLRMFSRSGEQDPFVDEYVTKIVKDTLALCEAQIRSKNIAIEQDIDASIKINCSPVQISQVILNILSNASYELDHVTDRDRIIKISARRDGENILISVSDNGRGIASNIIERVMQPFFTTKPVGDGTGLGLSISKGIVESHRGRFEARSIPGFTEFKIALPEAKGHEV